MTFAEKGEREDNRGKGGRVQKVMGGHLLASP